MRSRETKEDRAAGQGEPSPSPALGKGSPGTDGEADTEDDSRMLLFV